MNPSISLQFTRFAGAMLLGSLLGLLYHLSRLLCRKRRGFARAVTDVCYCLLSALLILLFLLIHTQGRLRWYLALGCFLGFCAWQTCMTPLLRPLLRPRPRCRQEKP